MEPTDEGIIERLQARVDAVRAAACGVCARNVCGHEILFSVAMGLGDKPRCLDCLAAGLGKSTNPFRDHLNAHFRQRHCYAEVWRRENQREGFASDSLPGCLWSAADPERADDASESSDGRVAVSDEPGVAVFADETWDAGDIACGDLVLGLRHRMSALTPRARLMLVARDPGATEDIPAWCRMTGHALLAQHHPHYWIQRKD